MNKIKYNFPKEITMHGQKYPIRNDFKTWGGILYLIGRRENELGALYNIISSIFIEIPPDLAEAAKAITKLFADILEHGEIVFDAPPEES